MTTERQTYVVIETHGSDRIRGEFNFYCVPWSMLADEVKNHLEDADDGKAVRLTFTLHRWTDGEYQQWAEDNEVETP